jgi:regulator of protease activity HflC (stomatin/prohibitin superfamily)
MIAVAVIVGALVALLACVASVRILKQYERGVQFRRGKVKNGARGPGLIVITPLADQVRRVSLRIVTMPIQSQGIITKTTCPSRCPRSPTSGSRARSARLLRLKT